MINLISSLRFSMILAAGLLQLLIVAGCNQTPPPSTVTPPTAAEKPAATKVQLRIAAASDLQFAFPSLNKKFSEVHPEITLEPTFGASGTFFAQIDQGAPFDLFLSADERYPQQLIDKGLTLSKSPFQYAQGHIVLWVPRDSELPIEENGLRILTDPHVQKISIANPKTAPYGRAAEAALRDASLWDPLQPKIVLGENASQATQFAESGNAQAGLLPLSHALSEKLRHKGRFWKIPEKHYPPIIQAGVILKSTKQNAAAQTFQEFLLSPEGRKILAEFGLQPETP